MEIRSRRDSTHARDVSLRQATSLAAQDPGELVTTFLLSWTDVLPNSHLFSQTFSFSTHIFGAGESSDVISVALQSASHANALPMIVSTRVTQCKREGQTNYKSRNTVRMRLFYITHGLSMVLSRECTEQQEVTNLSTVPFSEADCSRQRRSGPIHIIHSPHTAAAVGFSSTQVIRSKERTQCIVIKRLRH